MSKINAKYEGKKGSFDVVFETDEMELVNDNGVDKVRIYLTLPDNSIYSVKLPYNSQRIVYGNLVKLISKQDKQVVFRALQVKQLIKSVNRANQTNATKALGDYYKYMSYDDKLEGRDEFANKFGFRVNMQGVVVVDKKIYLLSFVNFDNNIYHDRFDEARKCFIYKGQYSPDRNYGTNQEIINSMSDSEYEVRLIIGIQNTSPVTYYDQGVVEVVDYTCVNGEYEFYLESPKWVF